MIDTVAGGLGEGNSLLDATFGTPIAIARDPQNRGLYVVDAITTGASLIRFLNTSSNTVTIGGISVAPRSVRAIAGGGLITPVDPSNQENVENVPALQADLGNVGGIAVSNDGNLVYFSDLADDQVRAVNVSANPLTVAGGSIGVGRIRSLIVGIAGGNGLNGIAVHPTSGEVYVVDSSSGINKVFKITSGGVASAFAGNGSTTTKASDAFVPGAALGVPLLAPRAIEFDNSGNLFIADTGHARVIKVDGSGSATLVNQFSVDRSHPDPFASGLAFLGGNIYSANSTQESITRLSSGFAVVAGAVSSDGVGTFCDYTSTACGDGGTATNAGFNFVGTTNDPPVAGIESDGSGLFILDQGPAPRGRVRYVNLSGSPVTIGGVTIGPGAIDTIAGNGLFPPAFDGGLATSATFSNPVGVVTDSNGNLWIADSDRLRFANRTNSNVTLFPGTTSAQTVAPGRIVTVNKNAGKNDIKTGNPVIQASFRSSQGLFLTSQGIYLVDSQSGPAFPRGNIVNRRTSLIRFINTTSNSVSIYPTAGIPIVVPAGDIATIAGGGVPDGTGDGGLAVDAKFLAASDIVVAPNGTIYVTDVGQKAVRKIDPNSGVISSLNISQKQYTGIGIDSAGLLYLANFDDNTVLRETGAGTGVFSALAAGLVKPRDVAVASDGSVYVTVAPAIPGTGNNQIVRISSGSQTIVAGGAPGFGGDGGAAINAQINISPSPLVIGNAQPSEFPLTVNIVAGPNNEIFFTDTNNNRIRRLSSALTTCVKTGTITIGGTNPTPQVTALSPSSIVQGSPGFTLTVTGTGFVPTSTVRWNGSDRTTNYNSSMQLTASIPASDLVNSGVVPITVSSPTPGGGISNAVNFTVNGPNPVPTITSLAPNTTVEGSTGFTLTVNGVGFVSGSSVQFDGQTKSTTFISNTQVRAQILANDVAVAGDVPVTVTNPTPGGGTSPAANFSITAGTNPAPVLTSISPNSALSGGPEFIITANGSNFAATSILRFNGQDKQTTVISSTQLAATITAADIASATTVLVTIFTPQPGGGTSDSQNFTITQTQAGQPTLSSLSPNAVAYGGQAFTLTVNGVNFVNGATVRVNGNDRTTAFVSASQLTATVPATDIAGSTPLTLNVTVVNPGGSASTALPLAVVSPFATVSAASFSGTAGVSANSIVAGFGAGMTTQMGGATPGQPLPTNLLGTSVRIKDSAGIEQDAPLFYVSGNQINYLIPNGTADGTATATVSTNGTITAVGQFQVTKISPSIFVANFSPNPDDQLPAAVLLRGIGEQRLFDPIVQFDNGQSKFVPVPIDFGPENNVILLILYGTALRGNSGGIAVTVNGVSVPAAIGPSGEFVGLDQINVGPLPRSLMGSGLVEVVLTVDGKVANKVKVAFK